MTILDSASWKAVLASAFELFDDLERRGFGPAPFSLGGGTALMFAFRHRLSKDIDLFSYDAQWLTLLTPRLNDIAASLATDYSEQANVVKIVMPHGDIDFIVAADIMPDLKRTSLQQDGRVMAVEPAREILAKKLFYRAAGFKMRDVYDMSAAIELDREAARAAVLATRSRREPLLRRLSELARIGGNSAEELIPFEGELAFADGMLAKVSAFVSETAE